MEIEKIIPVEVLSNIVGFLLAPEGWNKRGPDVDLSDLRNARLVCRRWHSVASSHMFRNVALLHTRDGEDFTKFEQLVASPTVQHAARRVEIYSGPHHYPRCFADDRSCATWAPWERSGDYEDFTSAIDCIAKLPKLRAVHIRFSENCNGDQRRTFYHWAIGVELVRTRLRTLRAVLKAMRNRAALETENPDKPITAITSFTLQNMQNKPFQSFAACRLFKSATKDVTELRLLVAREKREHDEASEAYHHDRLIFEPWLQRTFLPMFASKLRSLHLSFNYHWGVAPGFFDGEGLFFPNLKTLTLGKFVVGHHNQFDWVLSQKSLETLRLDRCTIVSYLNFSNGWNDSTQLEMWETKTHDWKQYPKWSFGLDDETFSFPGTWETVFDGIRANLLNLVDFRMENPPLRGKNFFNSAEGMRCMLTCLRYITFDDKIWTAAEDFTGEMTFGNNDPAVLPLEGRRKGYLYLRGELNRAKETLAGDSRAFTALVRTVEERRRQRGLDPISA